MGDIGDMPPSGPATVGTDWSTPSKRVEGSSIFNRRSILPILYAAALTLIAGPGVARVGVVVGFAPPAPVVEVVPPSPAPGYVWQPGYWSWNGTQYVWVPGAYVVAPFVHAVWVPGAWVRHGPGWIWVAGHWRR
jgi:WXXGXW repeat (2 copies)